MTRSHDIDEMREMAALYALSALSQREANAFEAHIAEGCEFCRAELDAFEQTASLIALEVEELTPSPRVRENLLATIADSPGPAVPKPGADPLIAKAFESVRTSEGEWQKADEGIFIKPLYFDAASGIATTLVRMMPGTALPAHQHNGVEQFFILEGDCSVRGEVLGPGDYHRAAAGTIHETTFTVRGTTFLLVAPEAYTVLGP